MKTCHKMWISFWIFSATIYGIFCMDVVVDDEMDNQAFRELKFIPKHREKNCANDKCDHCLGTKNGRNRINPDPSDPYNHYAHLRKLFENCKRIIGNLEITHIDAKQLEDDYDEEILSNKTVIRRKRKPFWFLKHLEQISGYLLIYQVGVERIDLPNLKIIWGRKLFMEKGQEKYALAVENSKHMKILNMPELRSIENGEVIIRLLPKLCYVNKINFHEFLGKNYESKVHLKNVSTDCPQILECHEKCGNFCYGPETNMCQDIYRHHCSPTCASGMCYKNAHKHEICCDEKCIAGCTGTGAAACVGCKDFEQDGVCVDRCRGTHKYDHFSRRRIELPDDDKRYTFEKHCDKKCPTDTLIEGENCVERCSEGYYQEPSSLKKECIECKGPCPKECDLKETINSVNIKNLINCTRINGYIEILSHSWNENYYDKLGKRIPGLIADDLYALKDITFVSGYVNIEGGYTSNPYKPKSLDFLSNLQYIDGRQNHHLYTLQILANPDLEYLGLKKLKRISHGKVMIRQNDNLCYGHTINWEKIMKKDFKATYLENAPIQACMDRGRVCDETCAQEDGCWGPGSGMCIKCKKYIKDGECSNHCPIQNGYFIAKITQNATENDPHECNRCYEHCKKCTGPEKEDCVECWPNAFSLTVETQSNPMCVEKCPENETYHLDNTCAPCHNACLPFGCTGSDSHIGLGGCKKCNFGFKEENGNIQCLLPATVSANEYCPLYGLDHYFLTIADKKNTEFTNLEQGVCLECQDVCSTCTQHSDYANECQCKYYRLKDYYEDDPKDKCVEECPENSYIISNKTENSYGRCRHCHSFCADHKGCNGPEAIHCDHCKFAGAIAEGIMICLDKCPDDKPYVYTKDGICYDYDKDWADAVKRKAVVVIIIFSVLAFLIVMAIFGVYLLKFRKKYRHEKEMHLPEIPEYDKTSIIKKPNMNQIHLISIDELLMPSPQKVLGEGAFGVVFAGKYKITGKKITIPVAIKAINFGNVSDGSIHVKTGNTEAEMIEEAGIMAKLHHEHLLRLVGICFAKGVKIVTLLRPLGPLNKFLQQHHRNLGSRDLMLYCYQISSAMEYLAKHKIVHCDLAARNVLMRKIDHVEVTDFGLARILEGANPTTTINTKLPVKWMPIECLANRRSPQYSEATDVWSFGVTCWEILMYGDMPYRNVTLPKGRDQAESLFQYLDNGGRLKQPPNCSQELYQLLLTCWATSSESRPRFKNLKETLMQYNRAPHQFVMDHQITMRMDSMTDSEQQQRKLLEELLKDSDFFNPMDDQISNYLNQSNMTNLTMETDLPPSPISPSRPLIGTRTARLSSTGTNSTRYKSEPGGKRQLSVTTENGLLDEEITDEENYLVPKKGGIGEENIDESQEHETLYTPVIAKTMEYENNDLIDEHSYLNTVISNEYYKAPPDPTTPPKPRRLLHLNDHGQPKEYINSETTV